MLVEVLVTVGGVEPEVANEEALLAVEICEVVAPNVVVAAVNVDVPSVAFKVPLEEDDPFVLAGAVVAAAVCVTSFEAFTEAVVVVVPEAIFSLVVDVVEAVE